MKSDPSHNETEYIDYISDISISNKYGFIKKYKPTLYVINKEDIYVEQDENQKNILDNYKKIFSSTVIKSEGALMLEIAEPEEIAIFMNKYKEFQCIYDGREEGTVKEVNKGINFSMNPTKIVFCYLHLRKRFKQGEYVNKGDIIGESGDEGKNAKNTKGPHVHFEIIDNSINYDIYSLQNLSNKGSVNKSL